MYLFISIIFSHNTCRHANLLYTHSFSGTIFQYGRIWCGLCSFAIFCFYMLLFHVFHPNFPSTESFVLVVFSMVHFYCFLICICCCYMIYHVSSCLINVTCSCFSIVTTLSLVQYCQVFCSLIQCNAHGYFLGDGPCCVETSVCSIYINVVGQVMTPYCVLITYNIFSLVVFIIYKVLWLLYHIILFY